MLSIFLDHSVNVSCFSHSVVILSAVRLSVFSASLLLLTASMATISIQFKCFDHDVLGFYDYKILVSC